MKPEDRIGQLIRSRHPYAFRWGQWGQIMAVIEARGRPCYAIEWDITTDTLPAHDFWPVDDPTANYEFSTLDPVPENLLPNA